MTMMKRAWLVLAVIWTLGILTICWTPMRTLTPDDGSESWLFGIPNYDKSIHSGIFLVFAVLWQLAAIGNSRWLKVLVASVLLAALTEVVQGLPIIGRHSDIMDAVTDIAGAVFGLLLVGSFTAYASRKKAGVTVRTPA